jgi:hypothetical protein
MAIKTFTVASYEVTLSRQMTIGGGAAKFYANILCRSSDGYRFAIYFLRPDSNEIANVYNPTAKWATSYLPADHLVWYLDLLRNEKPVYAYLNSETPIGNRLYTGAEPVGEGED